MEEKLSSALTSLRKEDATTIFALARTQRQISDEANKALAEINAAIKSLTDLYVQKYDLDEDIEWELMVSGDTVSIRERAAQEGTPEPGVAQKVD